MNLHAKSLWVGADRAPMPGCPACLYLPVRQSWCDAGSRSRSWRQGWRVMQSTLSKSDIEALIRSLGVLVVDDSQYMRKIVRNLLMTIGVRQVHEASDGIAGLDAIRTVAPDVVILDWELPLLNGAEFV